MAGSAPESRAIPVVKARNGLIAFHTGPSSSDAGTSPTHSNT